MPGWWKWQTRPPQKRERKQLPVRVRPRVPIMAVIAQSVEHRFEGPGVVGSTPTHCTNLRFAQVVEVVDIEDLKSSAQAPAGSSPALGTNSEK